ncbi:alpha/beta fold hydrolase [Streptomyces albus subsp. chlorinus]|uniref:alpha/beta hydrolase family protein n=1 Tax=Streptomyces albus TaxID=1888 RepID=UPI00156FF530|nr:alpha/beta fold hydrolase [Streptomyces albus]NSC20011.1 alpha/beta fold hydrolase [Streptomyces albus subsp. chlorinus]
MSEPTQATAAPGAPAPVLSVSPVVLPAPGRAVDLEVRVSAPATGSELPVILLSHGQGYSNHLSSLNGYAPLANFWAAHGFVVIQPTHLSSATLSLDSDDPEAPLYWRSRAEDMGRVLDRLDVLEAAVPQLAGRLDPGKVAVAGHSMGGHTASLLLGARTVDPLDGAEVDLSEPRIKAGVLLAAPGRGGEALSENAARSYPVFLTTDFSRMTTPALVVAGDKDTSEHLTVSGPEWHTDPYVLSPGPKSLLTLFDAEHGLGGVSGYDVAETTDENPARVAAVQQLTWAYLRSALFPGDTAWQTACDALAAESDPLGQVESK